MAMRGLPELSYGTPVVRPAGVVSQDTGVGDLFRDVAEAADQINAKFIKPRAAEEAAKEGERAVTRDATGQIVVQKRDYLLPFMDEAYENAAETRYLVERSKDLDRDLSDAHIKHARDPEGFEAAVQGIKESYLGNLPNPDWSTKINDLIDKEAGQHLSNIRQTKFAADIKAAGDAIDAKITRNANDLEQLVRQGVPLDSPEAKDLLQQGIDLINSKVGNPAFDYSQERAELDIEEFKAALEVGAIAREAELIYRKSGEAAAREWFKTATEDGDLKDLDPRVRSAARVEVEHRLNVLEGDRRAAELDVERKRVAADRARQEAAEAASSAFTSLIIADPTKVNPLDIAKNPNMTDEQKRVTYNFLQSRLADNGDGETNAAFWTTYQQIMAPPGTPGRINDVMEIYKLAPKNLSLPAVQKLVNIFNQRKSGEPKGDFETSMLSRFDRLAHETIAEPFGPSSKMPGGEEAYFKFFMESRAAYEKGREEGLSPSQLLDPNSKDYIGKNMQSYVPAVDESSLIDAPTEEAPEQSWFSWLMGTKAFSLARLDETIRPGPEGSSAGIAALKAAIAAGKISKDAAGRYAISRGWVVQSRPPGQPIPTVPAVMR